MKKLMFMLTVAACAAGTCAAAQQGASFAYQGCVIDATTHKPLTNRFAVVISLYPEAKSTTASWVGDFTAAPASNGMFNVTVADTGARDGKKLADVLSNGNEVYLGLAVKGKPEIPARQRLLPVPNAVYAQNTSRANGDFAVAKNLTVGGDVKIGNSTLNAKGEFNGKKLLAGSVDTDSLHVYGPTTVEKNLTVTEAATFKKEVEIVGTKVTATNAALSVKSLLVDGADVALPKGTIVMWYGSMTKIPDGWVICDGNNDTPNLCGRFPYGASDTNNKGKTGGTNEVLLAENQLAPHHHQYFGDDGLVDVLTVENRVKVVTGYDANSSKTHDYSSAYYKTTTPDKGQQKSVSIMPPYVSVYFIMKIK